MDLSDLEEGNKVRVTVAGTVSHIDSYDGEVTVTTENGCEVVFECDTPVDIKVIEPPFKAGDIVRNKNSISGSAYVLLRHKGGVTFDYFAAGRTMRDGYFDRDSYELLASVEVAK